MKFRSSLIIALFFMATTAVQADTFSPYVNLNRTGDILNVAVDTSDSGMSLFGTGGYLYFQYSQSGPFADSTATIDSFSTDGVMGDRDMDGEVNGVSAGTGPLPANVVFDSRESGIHSLLDYNQAITFGDLITFQVLFAGGKGPIGGASTFSLGLFEDAYGEFPLVTDDGLLFTADFVNTPEPTTLLLMGPALLGVWGLRRRSRT